MNEAGSYNSEDGSYDQLVAYLDGELDADSSTQIERRLAEDEEFRRELRQLQRAWEMLDELPKSEVSELFAQTTVEMVALSAEQEWQQQQETDGRRTRWGWILAVCGLAMAALAAYWLTSVGLNHDNEKLVRDLPVIENIELYRDGENLDYIRELAESGLFDEETQGEL